MVVNVGATDRYCFDVSGYRVVRGALTPEEVAVFNAHLDASRRNQSQTWDTENFV